MTTCAPYTTSQESRERGKRQEKEYLHWVSDEAPTLPIAISKLMASHSSQLSLSAQRLRALEEGSGSGNTGLSEKAADDEEEEESKLEPQDEAKAKLPPKEEVYRKPWKYIGYKGFADFISSEDDFFVLRRFEALNTRIALVLQDEIVEWEEKLRLCDEEFSQVDGPDINNGTLRGDMEKRRNIIKELVPKLKEYNEFILTLSELKKIKLAPAQDVKQLATWLDNLRYCIPSEERAFLTRSDDLISVKSRQKTPMRHLIDKSHWLRTLSLWEDRERKKRFPYYLVDEVSYFSDAKIDAFATAMMMFTGVVMLILPLWLLAIMTALKAKLGVITAFVLIFLMIMSYALAAKPFQALSATAAYAAVLMVFIQVGP